MINFKESSDILEQLLSGKGTIIRNRTKEMDDLLPGSPCMIVFEDTGEQVLGSVKDLSRKQVYFGIDKKWVR